MHGVLPSLGLDRSLRYAYTEWVGKPLCEGTMMSARLYPTLSSSRYKWILFYTNPSVDATRPEPVIKKEII